MSARKGMTNENGNEHLSGNESRKRKRDNDDVFDETDPKVAPKNVQQNFKLSEIVQDPDFRENLKAAWDKKDHTEEGKGQLLKHPFTCCNIAQLVSNDSPIDELVEALNDLEFREKSNDLYKFKQSDDLTRIDNPMVKQIRQFLKEEVRTWVQSVTSISLNDSIDLFCGKYEYTDYLLCHDDRLEGRKIAFIWYLVPKDWKESDGGCLDLFDTDDKGLPKSIVESIYPSQNRFAFFEVTEKSFHQVAEVLSQHKIRLSLGGWFHGENSSRNLPPTEPLACDPFPFVAPISYDEDKFCSWMNPVYLDPSNQGNIQAQFQDTSEIALLDFFKQEKYEELCAAFSASDLKWNYIGPPNRRWYETIDDQRELPEIIRDCLEFLKSEFLFLMLSNLTGLRLHELAAVSDDDNDDNEDGQAKTGTSSSTSRDNSVHAKCSAQVRRWRPGSYTLIQDHDPRQAQFLLDARLFFNCKDWQSDYGGFSSYLAKDEDEELISVDPVENCFMLVYRNEA